MPKPKIVQQALFGTNAIYLDMSGKRMVLCLGCAEWRRHEAKGLCGPCYRKTPARVVAQREAVRRYSQTTNGAAKQKQWARSERGRASAKGRKARYRSKPEVQHRERLYRIEYKQRPYAKKAATLREIARYRKLGGVNYRRRAWFLAARDGWRCNTARGWGCGKDLSDCAFEVDHIHPVARADSYVGCDINEDANLQLLCPKCNGRKGDKVG